jgi:hypothetical protein
MSEIKLSPTKRREMKRLGKLVDKASEADRLFFERHPDRRHRVRLSHQAEIRQNEIIEGERIDPPPGFRWFTAVRNIRPGARMRLFTLNVENAETDLPEVMAREVYQRLETPLAREVEALMGGDRHARH